jgi:hypothetical protein
MKQLKPRNFICNIFYCFNEENKMFSNFIFLSLFFFYLLLLSVYILIVIGALFRMYSIDILMKKTKTKGS